MAGKHTRPTAPEPPFEHRGSGARNGASRDVAADVGVIDRVQATENSESRRPPSRLEPAFPPTVFRRLDEMRE